VVRAPRPLVLVLALLALVAGGCAAPAPPAPPPAPTVDPGFVHGTDGGPIDRLAATVLSDAQRYWAAEFPALFGKPWREPDGGFFSADTSAAGGRPPPCSASAQDLQGNAYYCAAVDAIAWDRSALLPVLREHYGDAAVAVVLSHELGHAVQQRSGVDTRAPADALRTESGADCYAGSFLRTAADGRAAHLRFSPQQLDRALHALIVFRDPIGADPAAGDAHGTSFDRITAFQQGFERGPGSCGQVPHPGTAITGGRADDANKPLQESVAAQGIPEFFTRLTGHPWTPPPVRPSGCAADPVASCGGAVVYDPRRLGDLHDEIGDQAATTLIASRQALAALGEQRRPTTGPAAGRAATCLTGAYTATAPGLSAGDLDEAVEVLLVSDAASRDARGTSNLTGAERVAAFRTGLTGGPQACR